MIRGTIDIGTMNRGTIDRVNQLTEFPCNWAAINTIQKQRNHNSESNHYLEYLVIRGTKSRWSINRRTMNRGTIDRETINRRTINRRIHKQEPPKLWLHLPLCFWPKEPKRFPGHQFETAIITRLLINRINKSVKWNVPPRQTNI